MDDRFLGIYLNDHVAGAMVGRELARRCLSRNRGTELGEFLERLLAEIDDDLGALLEIIDRLHLRRDPAKQLMGWATEKVTRIKPNGAFPLLGYSPLMRFEELEMLSTGIEGKGLMWRALGVLAELDPRIHGPEMKRLADRADAQRSELEPYRMEAARLAFERPAV